MATLTIDLPDKLAEEARDAGLLAPGAIEAMLRESLRCRAADGLFAAADKLAKTEFPTMTMVEIQEEVNAVRSQRRRHACYPTRTATT